MHRLLWPPVLVLGLLQPRMGAAQEITTPEIDAGAVATVVLRLPAPGEADSASFDLDFETGYRSFVPLEGTVGRTGDRFLIPVSFATPGRLPAGRVVAGQMTVRVDGGEATRHEFAIQVRERRELHFALEATEVSVAPDAEAGIPFRLHNRGNLPDTVYLDVRTSDDWSVLDAPRVIVQPGDSATGTLRIAAPVRVSPGDRELMLVTASTTAGEQTHTLNVVVVSSSGWLGGLTHVPSSIFVGQALGGSSPVVALSGGGRIGHETDIRLDVRHAGTGTMDPALQRQIAGAGLRASLSRPGLGVEVGDIYGFQTTFSGSLRQARGVRSEYDPEGPLSFRGVAALPGSFGATSTGGHVLHGEAGLDTRYGHVSMLAGDMVHPARGTIPQSRSTGAGLRWNAAHGSHSGAVEVTGLRFSAGDSLHRAGAALDLDYELSTERISGRLGIRRVPDAATTPGGQGNEISASFSAAISPRIYVVGWGYGTEQNMLGMESTTESNAANLALRGRFDRLQVQLGGFLSERRSRSSLGSARFSRETARAEASYSRGPLSIEADVEVGTSREATLEGGFAAVGTGARWYGDGRWGWIRMQHTDRPGDMESTSLHAGGTVAFGPAELSGGLSTTRTGSSTTTSFWSGTEIQARRNLSIHLGASARPTLGAADWTFSLGFSRRLNLPLPLARQPDLEGVVFNDANDNGVLDPGEEGLVGATASLGYLETRTDEDGHFAFQDATGEPLRIHTDRLPIGYVLSPNAVLRNRGRVNVPLVRTATVHLDLFLDRDEDGQRDRAESVGAGVSITITDERGRQRTATADTSGTVRVSSLLPGKYAITARPPGELSASGTEPQVLMEIELAPGAEVREILAVPLRRRTIRMEGDDQRPDGFDFFRSRK